MLNKLADQKWLVLRLWIKWSRFESWPGSLHCVLGQDPLLSQYPSPPSCRDEMGTSEFNVRGLGRGLGGGGRGGVILGWHSNPSGGE